MKKLVLKLTLGSLLTTGAVVIAQPSLTPISQYTNHKKGYVGNALYVLPNLDGNVSGEPYDVAVTANYHFHSGTSTFNPGGRRMVLCKKNAITGAPVAMTNQDYSPFVGYPANTSQVCKGILLDEASNRIYLFGTISNRAIIACLNLASLALDPTFGTNGVELLSNLPSEAIDAVLTTNGNLAVLMNEKDANNRNIMSILGIQNGGGWMGYNQFTDSNIEYYGARIRKYPFAGRPNSYWVGGKAVNASAQKIPLLWEITVSGSAPTVYSRTKLTSLSFTSPAIGYGEFVDFDFLGTQIIAVGNTNGMAPSTHGIYAKYAIPASFNLVPNPNFTNEPGAAIPGIAPTGYAITRCLVDPNGYTIVTSYDVTVSMGEGNIGYITPEGDSNIFIYSFTQVHKVKGLAKDNSGNIVAGGCDIVNGGITTGKFTCYPGAWPGVVNRIITSIIPEVDNASEELTLNAFPIPATDQITVNFTGIADEASIQIIDISGKKVKELNGISGLNETLTIDISNLETGTYFIGLITNEKSVMKKIVKQ